MSVHFSIHYPINSDNVANTTCRNAAPNQDRPYTMFHLRLHALILPTLLLTYCGRLDPKLSNLDLSQHNTLFHWSSFQSLWALAYLSLFTLFPFRKSGFLAAIVAQRRFLIKLLRTVEGSTWHPDEAARCWARSLLDFFLSLKEETLRNSDIFIRLWKFSWLSSMFFVLDLSLYFKFLYNSLNTTSWVSSLFADFPLILALLMENYDFMCVKFCDIWHIEWNGIESWSY